MSFLARSENPVKPIKSLFFIDLFYQICNFYINIEAIFLEPMVKPWGGSEKSVNTHSLIIRNLKETLHLEPQHIQKRT